MENTTTISDTEILYRQEAIAEITEMLQDSNVPTLHFITRVLKGRHYHKKANDPGSMISTTLCGIGECIQMMAEIPANDPTELAKSLATTASASMNLLSLIMDYTVKECDDDDTDTDPSGPTVV